MLFNYNKKMKLYKHPTSCLKKLCYIFFPIFIVLASILCIYQKQIYQQMLYTLLRPTPGTRCYHFWTTSDPAPIMDVYMFNWTNADQVTNSSVIPNFEEVGPYRFTITREKFDITFNENDTVSFKIRENYEFYPHGSKSLHDVVTTINPIALTIGYKFRFERNIMKSLVSMALSTITTVTMKHSVKELLFGGYQDEIMETLRPFSNFIDEELLDKFGFLMEKNKSQHGEPYNVYLGADEMFGQLRQYDYKYNNPFYTGECALYHGSTSEFYPILNYNDYVELFIPDICATSRLDFEKDAMLYNMYTRKFTSTYMFDNDYNEMNRCYCQEEGCMPSGVFNASLCKKKTPLFLSSPHFYNADPIYRTLISGMKPEKDRHEFFFYMEPNSGITFKYGVRAQMNMHLKPYEGIGFFDEAPDILVPILYLDETASLHDEILFFLYLLQNVPNYMMYMYIFLYLISLIILVYLISGILSECVHLRR